MISLDVSASAKLVAALIINPKLLLNNEPNIGFRASRVILFYIVPYFEFFYPRNNKLFMRTFIIAISSFQNNLNHLSLLIFCCLDKLSWIFVFSEKDNWFRYFPMSCTKTNSIFRKYMEIVSKYGIAF